MIRSKLVLVTVDEVTTELGDELVTKYADLPVELLYVFNTVDMKFSLVATDTMLEKVSQSKRVLWSKRIDEVDCAMLPTDIVEMYQFNIDEDTGVSTYTKALIEAQGVADFLYKTLDVVPMVTVTDYKWDNPAVVLTARPFGGTDDNGITRTVMSSVGTGTLVNTFIEDEEEAAAVEDKKDSRDLTKRDSREHKIRHIDGEVINGVSVVVSRDGKLLLPSSCNINLNIMVTRNVYGLYGKVCEVVTPRINSSRNKPLAVVTSYNSKLVTMDSRLTNRNQHRAVVKTIHVAKVGLVGNHTTTKFTEIAIVSSTLGGYCELPTTQVLMKPVSMKVANGDYAINCKIITPTARYIAIHVEAEGVTEAADPVEDETAGDNPASGMMLGPIMLLSSNYSISNNQHTAVCNTTGSTIVVPTPVTTERTTHASVTHGRASSITTRIAGNTKYTLGSVHYAVVNNLVSSNKVVSIGCSQVMKTEATYVIMA